MKKNSLDGITAAHFELQPFKPSLEGLYFVEEESSSSNEWRHIAPDFSNDKAKFSLGKNEIQVMNRGGTLYLIDYYR